MPVSDIIGRIRGEINYGNGRRVTDPKLAMKFWGASGEVSYPWKSLDTWFITENMRWGKFPANTDVKALVDRTTRADLWTAAAKTLGVANAPTGDSRGVETFFDGMKIRSRRPDGLPARAEDQARRRLTPATPGQRRPPWPLPT